MIRLMTICLAMAFSLAVILACDVSDTKMERWAEKFTQPAVQVSAHDLYREFVRDDETALGKYSGRRVLVSGTVFEVRDDDDFEPVVEFDVGQDYLTFERLNAQFAERHRPEVSTWSKGASISVVCYIPIEDLGDYDFESVTPLRMCQPVHPTASET